MIYYLQQHERGGGQIIDGVRPWDVYCVIDSCEASSWLGAKKTFGFSLSDVQRRLLAKKEVRASADVCTEWSRVEVLCRAFGCGFFI